MKEVVCDHYQFRFADTIEAFVFDEQNKFQDVKNAFVQKYKDTLLYRVA